MAAKLNGNEEEQILQTIEMFEVITRSNPDDYQSLDLLREAYLKLDRTEDALRTVRMLGEAYSRSGQYGAALEELDFVLERQPDDAEIVALRAEIAEKLTLDSPQEPVTAAPPRATRAPRSPMTAPG